MNIFKRVALLCLGLISLIVYIVFCGIFDAPGIDYTTEYAIYQDISNMSSLEDVEAYLNDKSISYDIKESKLVLPDYDDIEYIILPDGSSGYIKHSKLHHNLSRLDERDADIVTVKKELINNKTVETIYLEDNGLTYTKIANKYYIEPSFIYAIIIIISFFAYHILLISAIFILMDDFFNWLEKKKEAKKASAVAAELSSNDAACKS